MNSKQANPMMSSILFSMLFFIYGCGENVNLKPTISKKIKYPVGVAKKVDSIKQNDTTQTLVSEKISYDTTKKYIYLTFDDGPQNGTATCFELCKKNDIKATFFMVGNHASSPHLKQMVSDIKHSYPTILLANHSTTHANGKYRYFYNHELMAAEDFYMAQKKLDVPFKIIRLPGNTSWVRQNQIRSNSLTKPVCKILDSVGYNVIGWDLEWNFNHKTANPLQSPTKLLRQVENALEKNNLNTKNHLVILTHDRMFRNANYADSLAKFISLLKEHKNYVFETVDHYPNLKKL